MAASEGKTTLEKAILEETMAAVGPATMARLVRAAAAELEDAAQSAPKLLAAADYNALEILAHTIKGLAQSFGLPRLASCALALEKKATTEPQTSDLHSFRQLCESGADALQNWQRTLS